MHNIRLPVFTVLMLLGSLLHAQDAPQLPSLGAVRQEKFNQLFFDALREKALDNLDEAFVLFKQAHNMEPLNDAVCYELGILYFNRGNFLMAEDLLQKATALAPTNQYFGEALAEVYNRGGKKLQEAQVWEALFKSAPDAFDYGLQAAITYTEAGATKKSLAILKLLEKDFGLNAELLEARQAVHLKNGNVKKAAKELEKFIAQQPNPDGYRKLGQLYTANGMHKEALQVHKKMLALYPSDPRANLELAEHYRQQGDMGTSFKFLKVAAASPELGIDPKIQILVSLFQYTALNKELLQESYELALATITAHPNDPKGYAMLGDFLLRDQKFVEAREAFRTATRLPNGDKANIWNQILVLNADLQLFDSLYVDAQAANELFPSQPLPYMMLGYMYLQKENFKAAVEVLEAGLLYTLGNRSMERQFKTFLADAHHRVGQHKESDRYFDEILATSPDDAGILNNYAYFLAVRGENLERALQMTEKSNRLQPNDATFLDTQAWVLFRKGAYEEALEIITQAVNFGGGDSGEVLEHYGDILFKNNQTNRALEMWQKALELGGASAAIKQKIAEKRYVE